MATFVDVVGEKEPNIAKASNRTPIRPRAKKRNHIPKDKV